MDNIEKAIQFLVNPQRDFIGVKGYELSDIESSLHVGQESIKKLRGNGKPKSIDPFVDTVKLLFDRNIPGTEKLSVVIDEDWHNSNDPEFMFAGRHCVKGTDGAKLVGDLDKYRWEENVFILRTNSINVGTHPHYHQFMKTIVGDTRTEKMRVGAFGVWTNIKVEYLLLNLQTNFPNFPPALIGICEPLTATTDHRMHEAAIEKFELIGYRVFEEIPEYLEWMGLELG